jgi:hypothetical protein
MSKEWHIWLAFVTLKNSAGEETAGQPADLRKQRNEKMIALENEPNDTFTG